jgi:hypothetical protein
MQERHGASIHLEIPFYRQHYEFTCGPACLMMAMKYLDHNLHSGKDREIDLWREGNLVAVLGTGRFGLAFSAGVRGFSARVTSNTGGLDFVDMFEPPLDEPGMQLLKDLFCERRTRCRKLGVRERQQTITGKILRESLFSNHVPLIVTNSLFHSKEDLPHWIAVTGIDDRFLYFNNPSDARRGKRRIVLTGLQDFIGYHGAQSMVEVWKK